MTEQELGLIHKNMLEDVARAGGRIDQVYHCPDLEQSRNFNRKPMIGMGLQARRDFPEIVFRQSVMVGDTISDMRFGKRLKMKTVFISKDIQKARQYPGFIDLIFESLQAFAAFLKSKGH